MSTSTTSRKINQISKVRYAFLISLVLIQKLNKVSILEKIGFKNYEKELEMFSIGTTNIQTCHAKLRDQVF